MEKVSQVYRTKDYKIFKHLDCNREVSDGRVSKIKKSIQDVGYVMNPIIINERNEVIDGQGRLEALRQLDLPVDYIVVNGSGIKECRRMNKNMRNWTTTDYIKSYAEGGNVSYKYLQILLDKHKLVPIETVTFSMTSKLRYSSKLINSGDFECDADAYNEACKDLEYIDRFIDLVRSVRAYSSFVLNAIMHTSRMECVDRERLYKQVEKYIGTCKFNSRWEDAFTEIGRIYNLYNTGEKVYPFEDYRRLRDEMKRELRRKSDHERRLR